MESYKGIDYGLGQSNVDKDTGIRYGVIASNSLMPEANGEIWQEGAVYLPYCPHCYESQDKMRDDGDRCQYCDKEVDEWDYADEPNYVEYREKLPQGEIVIIDCLDSDYMIIKSPFVARGIYCSPCVPGAVDLDSSDGKSGNWAYCLPAEFFDDKKAPYVYNLLTVIEGE